MAIRLAVDSGLGCRNASGPLFSGQAQCPTPRERQPTKDYAIWATGAPPLPLQVGFRAYPLASSYKCFYDVTPQPTSECWRSPLPHYRITKRWKSKFALFLRTYGVYRLEVTAANPSPSLELRIHSTAFGHQGKAESSHDHGSRNIRHANHPEGTRCRLGSAGGRN